MCVWHTVSVLLYNVSVVVFLVNTMSSLVPVLLVWFSWKRYTYIINERILFLFDMWNCLNLKNGYNMCNFQLLWSNRVSGQLLLCLFLLACNLNNFKNRKVYCSKLNNCKTYKTNTTHIFIDWFSTWIYFCLDLIMWSMNFGIDFSRLQLIFYSIMRIWVAKQHGLWIVQY